MRGQSIGRYLLESPLGQGGMGTVWRAWDPSLQRRVALKIMPATLFEDVSARRRFRREAQYASALRHPGIATVHDYGETADQIYLVADLIEGPTLADRIAEGPLGIEEALGIAAQAAHALGHAHARRVIHRDLSPRNMILDTEGQVVLVDFGLAHRPGTTRLTLPGAAPGTMAYIAPELLEDEEPDGRVDIYGLGVILFEMLTGCRPYQGERLEALLLAILQGGCPHPSERRPEIPAEVDEIVCRAMARCRDERYDTPDAMAHDIHAVLEGRPAPARSPRLTPRPSPRRPTQLAILPFREVAGPEGAPHPEQFFALGVTDSVAAALSHIPGLSVLRASAPGIGDGGPEEIRNLAHDLGADTVLRGTLQRLGPTLRISYVLLDPRDGRHVGGDNVDGETRQIFVLEDRLAQKIAGSLHLGAERVGTHPDTRQFARVVTQEKYLQALGYLQRFDNSASVDGALHLLEELQTDNDRDARIQAAMARAFLHKYQLTRDETWTDRARAAAEKALDIDPESPDVLWTLGQVHLARGKPAEAARCIRRGLGIRPGHPESVLGLARALEAMGRTDQAEVMYLKALALRPDFWGSWNELGRYYFNHGRYARAEEMWRRVIELTPDNARGHLNLGAALFRLGRHEEALAGFQRSLTIRPEAAAYSSLGTACYFLGRFREAGEMFEKGVALRPAEPRLWGNLADAYRWIPGLEEKAPASYDQAITLMEAQLKLNPRQPEALAWLSEWRAKRGDFDRAVAGIRKALRMDPFDTESMARAVIVFHLTGARDEALDCLRRAIRSGYSASEFEHEPDLAALRSDPEFRAALHSATGEIHDEKESRQSTDRQDHPPHPGKGARRLSADPAHPRSQPSHRLRKP